MNSAYYDGDFDSAQPHGDKTWRMPFSGDGVNFRYVYDQEYWQKIDKFKPLALSTASPDTDSPGFFLVQESDIQPIAGGIGRWVRTYARVPHNRQIWESYAWHQPGLSPDVSPFNIAISGTPTNASGKTTITTQAVHGLQVDDGVIIRYNVKFNAETAEVTRAIFRKVLSVPTANSFTVDIITERATAWHNIAETGGRSPTTRVVTSRVELDYFHCAGVGAQYPSPEKIPLLEPENIVNAAKEDTDTYSPTTTPTLDEYLARVNKQEWIIAEPSILRRWMGNIYERATRFVRAE